MQQYDHAESSNWSFCHTWLCCIKHLPVFISFLLIHICLSFSEISLYYLMLCFDWSLNCSNGIFYLQPRRVFCETEEISGASWSWWKSLCLRLPKLPPQSETCHISSESHIYLFLWCVYCTWFYVLSTSTL